MTDHVVKLYRDEPDLVRAVGYFLASAVRSGHRAVFICTDSHRRVIQQSLTSDHIDVGLAFQQGRLRFIDAEALLSSFTAGDELDEGACREAIASIVDSLTRSDDPVRIFAEMLVPPWIAGKLVAAIQLERLWGESLEQLALPMLCAYPAHLASGAADAESLHKICNLHHQVLYPSAPTGTDDPWALFVISADFTSSLTAPRDARLWLAQVLEQWEQTDSELLGDAALVVTELTTNAVLHAGPTFTVTVRNKAPLLHISVRDTSPRLPMPRATTPMSRSGRGLGMVADLSDHWGAEPVPGGKVVWAELEMGLTR